MAEIKRGRRPGPSTTRDAILAAARERFAEYGYDRVRMRDVAADAGVDVALVTYHFGSKDGLFGAALFGSQLIGILLYRHVLHVEPVASMSREELVERAAPALQRHLTGS